MFSSASAILLAGGEVKLEIAAEPESDAPEYMIESPKCFLCDHILLEGDQPFLIFEQRIREDGQLESALGSVLSSALGRDIEEAEAHSRLLCETCNSTLLEFESLEQRFCEIRYRILSAYNRTARRNELEPIVFEINGVLQDATGNDDESESRDIPTVSTPDVEHTIVEDEEYSNATFTADADASALLDEVHDDIASSPSTEDAHAAFAYVDSDVQQQSSAEPENLTADEMDGQDMGIYNDLIEQISQTSGSDEAFSVDSQQDIEQYATSSQSTSEVMYHEAENIVVARNTACAAEQSLFKLDGNRYRCLVCKTAPPHLDAKSFAEHMRSAHKTPFYVCDLCHTGFAQLSELEVHIDAQHCVSANYECDICERVFSNYRVFRLHKRSHYGTGKQYECSECHKKYSSKNLLIEHMNMHTGARPYKCDKCPKDFASKYTLQSHVKIHTDRQRPYKCDECDKAFLNQQNLSQHKKLHVSVKAFICDICQKAFSTQHNLDVHRIVHSGQRPFICRTCGKSFARRADVKDHERIHTGERPFKCDMCPLAFAQRSNLTSHKKSTHFNEKLHRCEHCDRMFKRRRLLEYHVQAVHTGERPYKCQICDAGFVYPEHYKKHMIIHTGEKPYACEICGKQFNSSDNRKAHRFVHSDKKPYECLDCGAGFMRKPQLLAHIKHMKHSNDTIIVNQPQIAVTDAESNDNLHYIDESGSGIEEEEEEEDMEETVEGVETSASLQRMMQRASNILAHVDNGAEDTDAITTVSGQLIKDELGAVKYLEFSDLDADGQQEFTWVDIGGNEDKD